MAKPANLQEALELRALMRDMLVYEPVTGDFSWRITRRGKIKAGQKAGSTYPCGYRYISLGPKDYRQSHLAWLWMTGDWPTHEIDHKDRVKSNNAWSNLRAVTPSQNKLNRCVPSTSKSGVKGVRLLPNGKYEARAYKNRKPICLGTFSDIDVAAEAVRQAGKRLHGEYYYAA